MNHTGIGIVHIKMDADKCTCSCNCNCKVGVDGFGSCGAWFGDADGLEEWVSRVVIDDDGKSEQTDTMIIGAGLPDLPDLPDLACHTTPLGDGADRGSTMGDAPMEATSALIVTPMIGSEAKKAWMETFGPGNSTVTPDVVEAQLKMVAGKIATDVLLDTPSRNPCPCDFPDFCDVCIEREAMGNPCHCVRVGMNMDVDICDFCIERERIAWRDVRKTLFVDRGEGDDSGEGVD